MNEQQIEFAEQLIDEYQSEADSLYFKINRNGVFAFLGFGMAVAILGLGGEFTPYQSVDNFIGVASGACVVTNAISAVKRIVRRETLMQRIREIEYDLAMDELSTDKPKVYTKHQTIEK